MKNKLAAIGIGVIVVLGIGFGLYQFSSKSSAASISIEEAKNIATTQFPGTVVEVEYEQKGNRAVYEIEIQGDGKHFELYLDANTGEVLKLEEKSIQSKGEVVVQNGNSEPATNNDDNASSDDAQKNDDQTSNNNSSDDNSDDQQTGNTNNDDNTNNKSSDGKSNTDDQGDDNQNNDDQDDNSLINISLDVPILKDKAIEIALAEVGGNAVIEEIELDDDDGRVYYEIELRTSNQEIDLEVDAYTGEILSISSEYED